MSPLRVAILGSTGSIGRQALDVVKRSNGALEVVALAANTSTELIVEQASEFGVSVLALTDEGSASKVAELLPDTYVGGGAAEVEALASHPDVDIVLNSLVGAAGLRATIAALDADKSLALANKESLVVGGSFVTSRASEGQIIPVDSEHSAIFQCLIGENPADVERIWLTASGGPFRGWSRDRLTGVTREAALAHPTWAMGPKITIDSATLMNKGLEVIEAHHLFDVDYDAISVVVHPQSCIHSMVEFSDGSVKAHLGATDMRIPIQYAFSHPRRWEAPLEPVDFTKLGSLDFEPADTEVFGCLGLAFEAGRAGGTATVVLNAANEVAVATFLAGKCGFLDIEHVVERLLEKHDYVPIESLGHIESVDAETRARAAEFLGS